MSSPATDMARAVWFLGQLAERMTRQPDGSAVLTLPARYAVALAAYEPSGDTAVYSQQCPFCGSTPDHADNPIAPEVNDLLNAEQRPGGEALDTYSRADAIARGQLVDVSPMALRAGFRSPVALTSAAWERAVEWSHDGATTEEQGRRLWDVLSLARRATWWAGRISGVRFSMPVIPGGGRSAEMISLTLGRDFGDVGEPVITVMVSEEAGS